VQIGGALDGAHEHLSHLGRTHLSSALGSRDGAGRPLSDLCTGQGGQARSVCVLRRRFTLIGRRLRSQALGHALALDEEQEVVGTARLGVGATHVEAAEGMNSHVGAGGPTVDVEVADVEPLFG